jgi:hypothetical protein
MKAALHYEDETQNSSIRSKTMKTLKTMLVAVVAMAMTAGVAQAGIGSALGSIKSGLSKAGKAVAQAPSQANGGLKKGQKAFNNGVEKHIARPITQAAQATTKGVATGWKKLTDATVGNAVRGGKKVVSKVKKLFKR